MNNFLDNLRNLETGDDSDNFQLIEVIRDAANNLGENARRMLEIGILQDELAKLGFKPAGSFTFDMIKDSLTISILSSYVAIGFIVIHYTSPTWQQDVLTKVKEIINHDFKKDSTCK